MRSPARLWHLLTAVVASAAVLLQLVLVVRGEATLVDRVAPPTGTALVRFFSYFTVLSNLLVAVTTWMLALGRAPDRRWWRVLRLDAVVGIAVTGVVHWVLLRPLLDLDGANALADRLLHVVVPVLAVLGWVLVGPRGGVRRGDLLPSLLFPAAYLAWTIGHGAATGWYPYPFVDVGELGAARVAVNAVGVLALIVGLAGLALVADRWLARRAAR